MVCKISRTVFLTSSRLSPNFPMIWGKRARASKSSILYSMAFNCRKSFRIQFNTLVRTVVFFSFKRIVIQRTTISRTGETALLKVENLPTKNNRKKIKIDRDQITKLIYRSSITKKWHWSNNKKITWVK